MRTETDFLALFHFIQSEKFGKLQTINVTVNAQDQDTIRADLERIIRLAGGEIKRYSVVGSANPFFHAALDLFFDNQILVRYVYTQAPSQTFKDWRLYLTGAEVYHRGGSDVIECKKAVPEAKTDTYAVADFIKETAILPLSQNSIQMLEKIVAEMAMK